MLDASEHGEINAMAISKEGEHFVTGGEDKKLKVWSYDEGMCYFGGVGHSGSISKIEISPDQRFIVSVGTEGAIFIWHTPKAVLEAKGQK